MEATEVLGSAAIKMMHVSRAITKWKSVGRLGFQQSWKKQLPPELREILKRAVSPSQFKSKEDFESHLNKEGILIDGGGKLLSLVSLTEEKGNQKRNVRRYIISARELTILSSNDKRHYRWTSSPESLSGCKFREVVELLHVRWLDIAGSIDSRQLSLRTNYGAYLILQFVSDNYGLDKQPAQIRVQVGSTVKFKTAYLQPSKNDMKFSIMAERLRFLYRMQVLSTPPEFIQQEEIHGEGGAAHSRADGWMEIELGRFSIDGDDGMVDMSLRETGGNWKSGLKILGIEVRPVD